MKLTRTLIVLAILAWIALPNGPVWGQANFYEGKTLTIMIGSAPRAAAWKSLLKSSRTTSENIFPANPR